MPSVLFVCTANQFRSPLAAASFIWCLREKNLLEGWRVESAGTWTQDGRPALPVTKQNGDRLGLDGINTHFSRQVSSSLLEGFDLIIVMEAGHKEALNVEFRSIRGRIFLLTEVLGLDKSDIPDPIVLGLPADDIATELHTLIQSGADKIIQLARTMSEKRKAS